MHTGGKTKPLGNMSDEDRHARRIQQSAESKQRRRDLVKKMMDEDVKMCSHPLCISTPNESGACDHHSNNSLHKPTEVPCIKCGARFTLPKTKLCGFCHEAAEERTAEIRRINKNARRATPRKESACSDGL